MEVLGSIPSIEYIVLSEELGIMVHVYNLSILETEAEGAEGQELFLATYG